MALETQLRLSYLVSHQRDLTSGQSAHDNCCQSLRCTRQSCYCLLVVPRQKKKCILESAS